TFLIIALLSIAGIYFWFTGRVERSEEIEFIGDRKKFEQTIVDFKKMIGKMFNKPTIKIMYTSQNLKMYELPFIKCKINIKFISEKPKRISFEVVTISMEHRNDIEAVKSGLRKIMYKLGCRVDDKSPDLTHFTDKPW
ncbi:hypothetical protein, partial [[Eubacterium] cellulosolvens]